MATFRLINLHTGAVSPYLLGASPPYLAASHAWSEQQFPLGTNFLDSRGRQALTATVDQRFAGRLEYCWVDTICINQNSEADMNEQIPLMGAIFGGADAVLIILSCELGMQQTDVDLLTEQLEPAVSMHENESWAEQGAYWQSGGGRGLVVKAMKGLARLTTTTWATRVWTLQEYILGAQVVWIGADLESLAIRDILFSALPDVCDTLGIDECLGSEFDKLYGYFSGMSNLRLKRCDRTRVMELLGNRTAELPRDEVYGVMAASGVQIPPLSVETKEGAWSKWFEQAVSEGHIRWLLMPVASNTATAVTHRGWQSCILPPFEMRHKLSAGSALDTVQPLGHVHMEHGAVIIEGRWIGKCEINGRLGTVHEPVPNRIHRDITLIQFSQGRWSRACRVARAFGAGRYSPHQINVIAKALTRNWPLALRAMNDHKEDSFRMRHMSRQDRRVWDDFMELQMGQMPGINEGTAHLARLQRRSIVVETAIVLPAAYTVPKNKLGVIDLGARTIDDRCIFLVVTENDTNTGADGPAYHKVAVTLPITGDFDDYITQLPLQQFAIGGDACGTCRKQSQIQP